MEIHIFGDYHSGNFEPEKIVTTEYDKKILIKLYGAKCNDGDNYFTFKVDSINDKYYVLVSLGKGSKVENIFVDKTSYDEQKYKIYKVKVFNEKCCSCNNKANHYYCKACTLHECVPGYQINWVCSSCLNYCQECNMRLCNNCRDKCECYESYDRYVRCGYCEEWLTKKEHKIVKYYGH